MTKARSLRHPHTNQQHKAKCLAYRNGKRCGRVAKAEVVYQPKHLPRKMTWHLPVCNECKEALAAEYGSGIVRQECANGFTVHNSGGFSGYTTREYTPIT